MDGEVTSRGQPVRPQALLPDEGWVEAGPGARMVAKDPRTTRETTFLGGKAGGRAQACVGHGEESWIESGGFESTAGSGEAPGAEEWVVTPLGVVRYVAAKLSIEVGAQSARVVLGQGAAFAWVADDARVRGSDGGAPVRGEDGWVRMDARLVIEASGAAARDAARAAAVRCRELGKRARELTAALMAGGTDAGTVVRQVTTRRLARAACAVAGLRIDALPASPTGPDGGGAPSDGPGTAPLSRLLAEGNAGWRSLAAGPD